MKNNICLLLYIEQFWVTQDNNQIKFSFLPFLVFCQPQFFILKYRNQQTKPILKQ